MIKVFVYGTLLSGDFNHYLLESIKAKFVCDDVLHNVKMFTSNMRFPFLKEWANSHVKGEVYEIRELDIGVLDRLEGYSVGNDERSLYLRKSMLTESGHKVFVYIGGTLFNDTENVEVLNGDWREFTQHLYQLQQTFDQSGDFETDQLEEEDLLEE